MQPHNNIIDGMIIWEPEGVVCSGVTEGVVGNEFGGTRVENVALLGTTTK